MRTNRVVAAVGFALLSVCWGITSAAGATKSPLSIQIDLNVTTIATGHTIHGTAIIMNASSKAIEIQTWNCDQWLYVGLAKKNVPFEPTILLSSCSSPMDLLPGATRLPITVSTKFQSCEVGGTPRCPKSGMPSLPTGKYHIAAFTNDVPSIAYKSGHIRVTIT
jgi:hypothetical protein